MKSIIRWAIRNTPAMNTLMVGVMLLGAVSLWAMRREVFPEFDLEIIYITVPYPGASPEEVEEGICQKIEEAVRPLDGIKKQTSIAREGLGAVVLELESNVRDVQKVLNEARSEVDRITTFPILAEDPEVKQITLRTSAIFIGVLGPEQETSDNELAIRDFAERVRDDLLQLPSITQVSLAGAKDFQIDIELSEQTLRKYGLTLQEVADIVRRENLELPGGTIRTESQEVLLRGKNKQLIGSEIAKIPLITRPDGVVLTVADLGVVRDEFIDTTSINRVNGRPAAVLRIEKTAAEDLLAIVSEANDYVATAQVPEGFELVTWGDVSEIVRDRMDLLLRNGCQGMILVLLILAVFLDVRLAFWVAMGVPLSILGAGVFMLWDDQTMNMLSMFAFIMALGILVDDAIVVGENTFSHRQRGKDYVQAAVDGASEVMPSVTASVLTTIIAFVPLLFVPGIIGKFIAVLPLAMIAMLVVSLLEVAFILPCHLARDHRPSLRDDHRRRPLWARVGFRIVWTGGLLGVAAWLVWTYLGAPPGANWARWAALGAFVLGMLPYLGPPLVRLGELLHWVNTTSNRVLYGVVDRVYLPLMRKMLNNPAVPLSVAAAIFLLAVGVIRAGYAPFVAFPKLDANSIEATVIYPDGTPAGVTDAATQRLEAAIERINEQYSCQPHGADGQLVRVIHRAVGYLGVSGMAIEDENGGGSHQGSVSVEIVGAEHRRIHRDDVVKLWREAAGEFPGAETVTFGGDDAGPGGAPIEFRLLATPRQMADLEAAVERCKEKLKTYPGVFDITDDSRPGKWEFQLKVKKDAQAMGVPLAELAQTVRAAYYGEEVMRLQRGRHEVKLMVRYPVEERRSLANFDEIRVRAGSGAERPLAELAQVDVQRGYSEINRIDQLRSITVTADVDESRANARDIVSELKKDFLPMLLRDYPGLHLRWEGMQEQTAESIAGLVEGLAIALVAMFVLLTLEFRSYFQPILILAIIPFGAIGAVVGHLVMGLPVTLFSLFGLVALTGVVINDSIVLVDFINAKTRAGVPLKAALLESGRQRFRPVMLTSTTTIAGLMPLLLERSFQAQVLIPMAVSLCFGLAFTTVLVLVLVPTLYLVYCRATGFQPSPAEPDEDDDTDLLSEPDIPPELRVIRTTKTAVG